MEKIKISSYQLAMLMMGFIFGTSAISVMAIAAYQDAWIAFIMGWCGGFILLGIYTYLAVLNPSKTLIDILNDHFGKYLGSLIAFFYILYFVHDLSQVVRNISEYMIVTIYTETPIIIITISFLWLFGMQLEVDWKFYQD